MGGWNFNGLDPVGRKESKFVEPGYRKLTVKEFTYKQEDEGKTPVIVMSLEGTDGSILNDKLNLSGKNNGKAIMEKLQELFIGLTGTLPTADIQAIEMYTYTSQGQSYQVPNPSEFTKLLNKTLSGKFGIFLVGGESSPSKFGGEDQVFAGLVYKGFLVILNSENKPTLFTEERDLTPQEKGQWIRPRKANPKAPKGNNAMIFGNTESTPAGGVSDDLPF